MSDLGIRASLGAYVNYVEEPPNVREDEQSISPLDFRTAHPIPLSLASHANQLPDSLQMRLQHFPKDHPRYCSSPLKDLKEWPSHLNEDDAIFRCVCLSWLESLKVTLCHKLFQSLTTGETQTLYQEMFQKICEELDPRLPLPNRLTELTSSPHKETIENALRKHLKIWLAGLVETQLVNLLPALLHHLIPVSLSQGFTPYEELLAFMLQNLRSHKKFIKRFINLQQSWGAARNIIDFSDDPDVNHLIEEWFRQRRGQNQYRQYHHLWAQALSQDLHSLMLNETDPIQSNGRICQKRLLLLLAEIFPGGLREILQGWFPPDMSRNLLRPSYLQYYTKRDQTLHDCQHDFRRVLCDNLRKRIHPEMSLKKFLKWVPNQIQYFFQNWVQSPLQDLHSTVQRHLQIPRSFFPLVLDFQSAIAQSPDWLHDNTQPEFFPYAITTHSAPSSPSTLHSKQPPDLCQTPPCNPSTDRSKYDWVSHVSWPLQQMKNLEVLYYRHHNWLHSLRQVFHRKLCLHQSAAQTHALCQTMFAEIQKDLRPCLNRECTLLTRELENIQPPKLREIIEIGLRSYSTVWLEDLVKKESTKLAPDLLNNLLLDKDRFQSQYLQEISRKDLTIPPKYREILTSALQKLNSIISFEKLKQVEKGLSLVQKTYFLVTQHLSRVLLECPLYQNLALEQREKWRPFLLRNLVCLIVLNMVSEEIIPADRFVPYEEALHLLIPKMYMEVFPEELSPRLVQEPYLGLLQYLFPGNDQGDERTMHLEKFHKSCLYYLLKGIGINVTFIEGDQDTQPFTNWLGNHLRDASKKLHDSLFLEKNWVSTIRKHLETQKSRLALVRHLQLAIPLDLLCEELRSKSMHEEALCLEPELEPQSK